MALTDVEQEPARQLDPTSERLVLAAAEVFAEKGYEGAGVAEIARRAGFTTGAIYSRFSGKADLLAEAIRATSHHEFDRLFADHAFEGRAPDLLATVGSHLVTHEPDRVHALLLEAFAAARRHPEVAELLRDHLSVRAQRLAALVEDGKSSGLVDPTLDTASVVHFAHAVGLGFVLYQAVGTANPDVAAWTAVIQRMIDGLVPTTERNIEPDGIVVVDPPE